MCMVYKHVLCMLMFPKDPHNDCINCQDTVFTLLSLIIAAVLHIAAVAPPAVLYIDVYCHDEHACHQHFDASYVLMLDTHIWVQQ